MPWLNEDYVPMFIVSRAPWRAVPLKAPQGWYAAVGHAGEIMRRSKNKHAIESLVDKWNTWAATIQLLGEE
jgi:hypothetical protein